MPTLELLKLQLKTGVSPTSPTLLGVLSTVRSFVKTNSHFYTCLEDSSLLYILGEWSSLAAHKAFLSSPDRARVLAPQDSVADFVWCEHVDMPGSMHETLPLDAPVLAFSRLWIRPDANSCAKFEQLTAKYRDEIATGSASELVFAGWRADQSEGEKEFIMLSGWESQKQHLEWRETTRRDVPRFAGMEKCYDERKGEMGSEVVHLRDIERTEGKGQEA
jgi:heme-degrading monooxygenase HmoA